MNKVTEAFPPVEGRCPACQSTGTLFRGAGGYVTCSLDTCPDPGAFEDYAMSAHYGDGEGPTSGWRWA